MNKFLIIFFIIFLPKIIFADELVNSMEHEKNRNYAKALESMETLLRTNPNEYFFNLRAGWLALNKGDYAKSNTFYQKATLIAPSSIEARMGQAKALRAQGLSKQADVVCKALLKLDPKSYYARSSIAYSSYISGDFKEAEKYYQSILTDYPSDTEMQIGLAWTYLKHGKKAEAKKIFIDLSKIIPTEERVTSGLYYANN